MRHLTLPVLAFTVAAGLAHAGENEPTEAIEARVTESLSAMTNYLKGAQSLSFTAWSTTEDVSSTLQKLQFDNVMRGAIQRPNKLYLERSGAEDGALWFDGSTATILDRKNKKYVKFQASSIDALLDKLDDVGVETPMAGLLRGGMMQHVKDHVFKGDYYGSALIGSHTTHHLALRQDAVDWQIWLDDDTYAPRKIVITSKMMTGAPQHQIFFKELNKNPVLPEGAFNPQIPADAEEIPLAQSRDELDNSAPW